MTDTIVMWSFFGSIIFFVIVTGLKVFIELTKQDHSKNIVILRARAEIIVRAIDQSGLENTAKKALALTKLGKIAKEWKIPLSTDQASDYIEYAVNTVRALEKTKS